LRPGLLAAALLLLACARSGAPRPVWFDKVRELYVRRDSPEPTPEVLGRRATVAETPDLPLAPLERRCPAEGDGSPASFGTVTDGVLCRAERVTDDGGDAPWRLLAATLQRGTTWGAPQLVRALERAARRVLASHPGLLLPVGNLARGGGGDLPWSRSHNTGRDADLFFYMTDGQGAQAFPPKVTPIDLPSLSLALDGRVYRLDLDANLDLALALVSDQAVDVQWIFVANPIRSALLTRARERRVPPALLARLSVALHQPAGALPHDDHVHVRLACSARELAAGCQDVGVTRRRDPTARAGAGSSLFQALRKRVARGPDRDDALLAMWWLDVPGAAVAAAAAWPALDEEGRVLALALARRGEVPPATRAVLRKALRRETSPRVVRHGLDLLLRRLRAWGTEAELAWWAGRAADFAVPGEPFLSFRTDCLVEREAAALHEKELLKRLAAAGLGACREPGPGASGQAGAPDGR
jgi:murein endopeptidase